MANLPQVSTFHAGIYQIETTDKALGGVDGVSNRQAQELSDRTNWLKQAIETHDPELDGHHANEIVTAAREWLAGLSVDAQLTELVSGLLAQAETAGAGRVGNVGLTFTEGAFTLTVAAGTVGAQLQSLLQRLTEHLAHKLPGDHDGRYLRPGGATGAGTIAAGDTSAAGTYSIGLVGPPPVSVYYVDSAKLYLAGTGPRAADLEVWWEAATGDDWNLKIKNVGATSIDVRFGVARLINSV
jgi:hypothetical protein